MKNANQAAAVSIVAVSLIAAVAVVSAIHICIAAVRFGEKA